MPIARDTLPALQAVLGAAADADLILTIGGASVGDHDLLGTQADALGLSRNFYKVSMRPGKPLMAGRTGEVPLIGLPGNPVSALVCGTVFVAPVIRRMLGLPKKRTPRAQAILAEDIPANGPREHYARATLGPDGVRVFNRQDSSLLTVLSAADALVVRPPHAVLGAAADADLILTIGGASVGDHDLLGTQADALGLSRNFYKVSMRPGKPLMAGRTGEVPLIGLPGNPVSALVCGTVFVAPVIRRMLGLPKKRTPRAQAILAEDIPANGPREHYARATLGPDGVRVFNRQDSSLLTVLSAADALVVRPPHAPAAAAGTPVEMIRL
ncbi:Molybdopterin molybdenumtransferase (MPT Mo-transferase) [Durusdinium trenchii]|uniref:Molybdopterin molybdenumtransferase (MPT Mo-transferase) n=1 Tax=Durusdinium trenchii TaxID=1381693 RepID=A0ABP0NM23_9DINO